MSKDRDETAGIVHDGWLDGLGGGLVRMVEQLVDLERDTDLAAVPQPDESLDCLSTGFDEILALG